MRPPFTRRSLAVVGIVAALSAFGVLLVAGRADRGDAATPPQGGEGELGPVPLDETAWLDPGLSRGAALSSQVPSLDSPSEGSGADEPPCREERRTVSIGGAAVPAVAVVCRRAGGTWELAGDPGRPPAAPPSAMPPPAPASAPSTSLPRPENDGSRKAFLNSRVALRVAPGRGRVATRLAEAFAADDGRACRRYVQTARVTGVRVRSEGTVCRDARGRWRLVERTPDVRA